MLAVFQRPKHGESSFQFGTALGVVYLPPGNSS